MCYFKNSLYSEKAEIQEVNFNTTHLLSSKMEIQPQFFGFNFH